MIITYFIAWVLFISSLINILYLLFKRITDRKGKSFGYMIENPYELWQYKKKMKTQMRVHVIILLISFGWLIHGFARLLTAIFQ